MSWTASYLWSVLISNKAALLPAWTELFQADYIPPHTHTHEVDLCCLGFFRFLSPPVVFPLLLWSLWPATTKEPTRMQALGYNEAVLDFTSLMISTWDRPSRVSYDSLHCQIVWSEFPRLSCFFLIRSVVHAPLRCDLRWSPCCVTPPSSNFPAMWPFCPATPPVVRLPNSGAKVSHVSINKYPLDEMCKAFDGRTQELNAGC